MKLVLLSLFSIVLGAYDFAAVQRNGTSRAAAPRVSVDGFVHDFGEVDSGRPLRFTFKIKNAGDADLLIQSVAPG